MQLTTRKKSMFIFLSALCLVILAFVVLKLSYSAGVPVPVFPEPPPQYALYDKAHINEEQEWHISNTHDPSIYKDGDTYYVFSTDFKVDFNFAGWKRYLHGSPCER